MLRICFFFGGHKIVEEYTILCSKQINFYSCFAYDYVSTMWMGKT